jgi:hypothetical protein
MWLPESVNTRRQPSRSSERATMSAPLKASIGTPRSFRLQLRIGTGRIDHPAACSTAGIPSKFLHLREVAATAPGSNYSNELRYNLRRDGDRPSGTCWGRVQCRTTSHLSGLSC